MSPEKYFFVYAFPCAGVLLNNKTISKEIYAQLQEMFLKEEAPTKQELENVFKAAFKRIKSLGGRMGRYYWDIEVIKEYWKNEHNIIINSNDGNYAKFPESFKDFCKVHTAKVLEKKEVNSNKILIVEYNNIKTRNVFYNLIPNVNVGDIVTIHHAHAIELVA